jgi:hypothetical protein
MIEAKADSYPNVRGDSLASLAILEQYFSGSLKEYAYVPGLRPDDPKDLVLMSLRSKTRFDWHGDRSATIFTPKRWMVLPPGITEGKCTEGGELLETSEFARRLRRTLEFLKEQQRPHWHEIVTEQTKFLQSLDK